MALETGWPRRPSLTKNLAFLRWELGQFCLSCSVNNTSKQQWLKLIVRLAVVELAGWGWGGVVNDSHSDIRVQSAPRWRMLSEETLKVFINLTQPQTVSRKQTGPLAKPSSPQECHWVAD